MNFKGHRCDYCTKETREESPKWFGIDISGNGSVNVTPFDKESHFHVCSVACLLGKLQYGSIGIPEMLL